MTCLYHKAYIFDTNWNEYLLADIYVLGPTRIIRPLAPATHVASGEVSVKQTHKITEGFNYEYLRWNTPEGPFIAVKHHLLEGPEG